ncbi:MAG: polyprenyl synthetase family protein [Candidatus Nanopelagicales bacterium]
MTVEAAFPADPPELTGELLRREIQREIDAFLMAQDAVLSQISPDLGVLGEAIAELLAAGKRLRAKFCIWAYLGAGGENLRAVTRVGAGLEFLQACALIHDDVMDGSATRRGLPAVHERFAAAHGAAGWLGDGVRFGIGAAILAGDLCLAWADALIYGSGFSAAELARLKPVYDLMRTELMGGQYLDLLEQARGGGSAERAELVLRYKSAKYTIERPLHLGAALAGSDPALIRGLSDFGLPLGEAFQLRDDLLGIFGDPAQTGKPAGDDLREGKRTLLVAVALSRASAQQEELLTGSLGDPLLDAAQVAELREVIAATGAVDAVEELIAVRAAQADLALSELALEPAAGRALRELAVAATARSW